MKRICIVPRVAGVGGMVSFKGRITAGLASRGIDLTFDLDDTPYDAVLVIGGTRELFGLWRARRRGVRIVQRLNGMNWLHRKRPTGWRHFLKAEYGNLILRWIRSHLADHIVYQSAFARHWWERVAGDTRAPHTVIHNAVDLNAFTPPQGFPHNRESLLPQRYRLLVVEGSLKGGYELGLKVAIELAERLNQAYRPEIGAPVELVIAGDVPTDLQNQWSARASTSLVWAGVVPAGKIPALYHAADLLFSADINAACPNTVIEALACGLPVLAFDTGALPELVTERAGKVVPYGGDPWQLDPPDVDALAQAATTILQDLPPFQSGARQRAEEAFGLDTMVDGYLQALLLSADD